MLPVTIIFSGRSCFCSGSRRRLFSLELLIFLLLIAIPGAVGRGCPGRATVAFCLGGRATDKLTWTVAYLFSSSSSKSSSSRSIIGFRRFALTPNLPLATESCPSSISSSCHFFPPLLLTGRGSDGRLRIGFVSDISAPVSNSSSKSGCCLSSFGLSGAIAVTGSFGLAGLGLCSSSTDLGLGAPESAL